MKRLWLPLRTLCGALTGHAPSRTDWGYGGGELADTWCRWCGQFYQFPVRELMAVMPEARRIVWESLGRNIETRD